MQEIKLQTPHLELAALQWGNPGGAPVLALHGWLDNAASFLPMAPQLDEFNMVAIDWPGHGQSQHRHPTARYYIAEFIWDIHAAMDALGWSSCHLLGHSLGAAIGSMFAAAEPGRVRSLVMIDALGPYANLPSEATRQLRRSSESLRSPARPRKTYASIEDMVQARLANSAISAEAARLITERSAAKTETGYTWTNDANLYWASPMHLCEEQVLDYLQHIEAPTLSISATPFSRFVREEQYQQRIQALPAGRHELIEGGHHLHMEQPEVVAPLVQSFIMDNEQEYCAQQS